MVAAIPLNISTRGSRSAQVRLLADKTAARSPCLPDSPSSGGPFSFCHTSDRALWPSEEKWSFSSHPPIPRRSFRPCTCRRRAKRWACWGHAQRAAAPRCRATSGVALRVHVFEMCPALVAWRKSSHKAVFKAVLQSRDDNCINAPITAGTRFSLPQVMPGRFEA